MMAVAARSIVELLALSCAQGTVLAALAAVLARAGRLRPSWQAAVWLIVLARFVLPWGPALPWSLADLLAALRFHHEVGPMPVGGPTVAAAAPSASPLWLVLAIAWAIGAGIVVGRAVVAHIRVVRAARAAEPAPAHVRALLAPYARQVPRVVICAPDIGPHVVGFWQPIIAVPRALLEDPTLPCALLHELAHVRRRDALVRLVQLAAHAVFFFWPVVRLVSRRFDACREAACDAWALDQSRVPRPAYARLLVRMAQLGPVAAPSLVSARGLDSRVATVLGPPARGRAGIMHALALAAWAAISLGGARSAAAHAACHYTPELAEALRQAHPEADRDGDGVLSRDEACEFQAELRLRVEASELVSHPADATGGTGATIRDIDQSFLNEPLCCNCDRGAESSAPLNSKRSDTCQVKAEEGPTKE